MNVTGIRVAKVAARTLATIFAAFFGTLQLSMTTCQPRPTSALTRSLCQAHLITSSVVVFGLLFALSLLVLSTRMAALRRPLAVLLLVAYAIYGFVSTIEYQSWWLALVPVTALAAAIGVALRARWGTRLTYAISALFVIYWLWGVVTAARVGAFQSHPPLQAMLMLVPGLAFTLLAGFCCYACRS